LILRSDYAEDMKNVLISVPMPERVWLVEISIPQIFCQRLKLGEMVFDPRLPPSLAMPQAVLVLHLPGVLADFTKPETDMRAQFSVQEDRPTELFESV
jgi:hypothetical protein